MKNLKLKICGLRDNASEVVALEPDYAGFIFYEKSPRYVHSPLPQVPTTVKKVGVFVNAEPETVAATVFQHQLDVVQLHGDETPGYIAKLNPLLATNLRKNKKIGIWKVFGISNRFDFSALMAYDGAVDRFLFDTKSAKRGGTGRTFNWEVLRDYPFSTPFILSGGIGLESLPDIGQLLEEGAPIYAIDVNSKFELAAGLKDVAKLEKLQKALAPIQSVKN